MRIGTSSQHSAVAPFATLVAAALVGCGGGGDATVETGVTAEALSSNTVGGSSTPGAPDARHLEITVTEISVHVAASGDGQGTEEGGGKAAHAGGNQDGGGWSTIWSGRQRLDLLDATTTEAFLGSSTVPAGRVTQVRLILADDATLVDGTTTASVSCPSCTQSGLKIVTAGSVEVPEGGTLHLTLDLDQNKSLTSGPQGYRLDPVVRVARATQD
jgi:uncharacterized protein DUF4382